MMNKSISSTYMVLLLLLLLCCMCIFMRKSGSLSTTWKTFFFSVFVSIIVSQSYKVMRTDTTVSHSHSFTYRRQESKRAREEERRDTKDRIPDRKTSHLSRAFKRLVYIRHSVHTFSYFHHHTHITFEKVNGARRRAGNNACRLKQRHERGSEQYSVEWWHSVQRRSRRTENVRLESMDRKTFNWRVLTNLRSWGNALIKSRGVFVSKT